MKYIAQVSNELCNGILFGSLIMMTCCVCLFYCVLCLSRKLKKPDLIDSPLPDLEMKKNQIRHLASEDVLDYVLILRTGKQIPNTGVLFINSHIKLLMMC